MWSPIVVQNPGAVVQAASSPASARPATSPWASASPQCSTRRRRPARACSAAAMSPTASTAASELRIEASTSTAPSSSVETGAGGQLAAGRDAGPSRTRSAASSSPPARRTRQRGSMRSTSAPRRTSTPASHSSAVMSSPARSPRRCACGSASGATSAVSIPRRASDAAASQAMKPAPTTTARAPGSRRAAQAQGIVDRADVCRPGSSAPGTGGRCGAEPVASTQAS